jgi:hypothetical protein
MVAVPLAAVAIWLAVSLLFRAWTLRRERLDEPTDTGG